MKEIRFRAWHKRKREMTYFYFTNIYGYEGEPITLEEIMGGEKDVFIIKFF